MHAWSPLANHRNTAHAHSISNSASAVACARTLAVQHAPFALRSAHAHSLLASRSTWNSHAIFLGASTCTCTTGRRMTSRRRPSSLASLESFSDLVCLRGPSTTSPTSQLVFASLDGCAAQTRRLLMAVFEPLRTSRVHAVAHCVVRCMSRALSLS